MPSAPKYVSRPSPRDEQVDPISISTWSTIDVKSLLQSKQCTEEKNSIEVFHISQILSTILKYCNV